MRSRHFAYGLILMIATLTLAVSRMGASPPEAGGVAMPESLDVNPETRVYLPLVLRNHGTVVTPTPTPTLEPRELPPPPALVAPANGAQLETMSPSFTIDNSAIGQRARAELEYATVPHFTANVCQLSPVNGPPVFNQINKLSEGLSSSR